MHESILRDYFAGLIDVAALKEDLEGAIVSDSNHFNVRRYQIVDMEVEFEVLPQHLVKLCDAVLAGELGADDLETVGFCLQASDCFVWDYDMAPAEWVGVTVNDWSSPEINHPLTSENIEKFRHRLLTGSESFK